MKHSAPKVVITGAGICSALGNQAAAFQSRLFAGDYGIRPLPEFDFPATAQTLGAPLASFPDVDILDPAESPFYSNLNRLSLFCADQALRQASLPLARMDRSRVGVLLGSGMGNLADLEPAHRRFFGEGRKRVSPLTVPLHMLSGSPSRVAMKFGLRGVCQMLSTACASGLTAMIEAFHLIRSERQQAVLCGGVDLLFSEANLRGWEAMRVLSPEKESPHLACRPFDRSRSGLVLGDGAAVFLMESARDAARRGAEILAEVSGAFQNNDAFDVVKPDLRGQAECMAGALKQAGLPAEEIRMVQAHGTATQINDATEAGALSAVFGSHLAQFDLCAIKGQIGHTIGASGPLAVAAALGSLNRGYVYPVPNYEATDLPYALKIHTRGVARGDIRHILINAFGFGGANASMILSKPSD